MKSFLLFYILVCSQLLLKAQSDKISITLNPFSFIDTDAGIAPGIGYAINKHFAVFADVGFIFFAPYPTGNTQLEINNRRGINFKPAIRYYFKESEIQTNHYLELEGLFKFVRYNGINDVSIIDESGVFAYTYVGGYKVNKNISGVSLKIGRRRFFKKSTNIGFDVYGGFGVRRKRFSRTGIPAGAITAEDPFFSSGLQTNYSWTRGDYVYFPMGIKLFYNL